MHSVASLVSKRTLITMVAVLMACALAGCTQSVESRLVGSWTTRLVGYNTTAQSVTNYQQTVTFGEDGSVTLDTTLPGATNHVTGGYEIVDTKDGPTISISWDMPVDQPTTLFFSFDDDKLLTSPSPGGLEKPQNLNVTNADPVVYIRASAP